MSAWGKKKSFFSTSETWFQKSKQRHYLKGTHLAQLLINDTELEVITDHVLIKCDNKPWCLQRTEEYSHWFLVICCCWTTREKVTFGKITVCLPLGREQDKTYPHLLPHKWAGNEKVHFDLIVSIQRNTILTTYSGIPWPFEPHWGTQ